MLKSVHLGAKVEGANGVSLGKIKFLVANQETSEVTHIIVEQGVLNSRQVVVGCEKITNISTDNNTVGVDLTEAEFNELPEFTDYENVSAGSVNYGTSNAGAEYHGEVFASVGTVMSVDPNSGAKPLASFDAMQHETEKIELERTNVPDDSMIIQQGSNVEALDGKVGKIKDVNFDSNTGKIVSFTIEQGMFFTHEFVVPLSMVESATSERVILNATKNDLNPAK